MPTSGDEWEEKWKRIKTKGIEIKVKIGDSLKCTECDTWFKFGVVSHEMFGAKESIFCTRCEKFSDYRDYNSSRRMPVRERFYDDTDLV